MNKELLEALQNLRLTNPFAALELPMQMLAFLFAVIGYLMTLLAARQDQLRPLVRLMFASAFIAAIPLWTGLVREACYFLPYSLLEYHTGLEQIYQQVTNAVNAAIERNAALNFSLFDALGSVLLDFVVVVLMRSIATLGSFVAVPLLFLQIGLDGFCITVMPLAIAGLTVPAIRNQCQGFISFWVSVLLWPLLFSVVTVIAGLVFSVSNSLIVSWQDSLVGAGITSNFLAPFAAGGILIGGILSVPPFAYSLCAHGGAAITGHPVAAAFSKIL